MAELTIMAAIEQICQEKKLSQEQVLGAIEMALASAYRRDFGNKLQNIVVEFDPKTGKMKVFDEKTVVEDLPEEPSSASDEATEGKEEEPKKQEEAEKGEDEEEKRRFNPKLEIQISEVGKDSTWYNTDPKAKKIKMEDVIRQELEIPAEFGRIAAQTAKQVIIQRLREAERETIFERYQTQVETVINGVIQRKEGRTVFIDLSDATAVLPYFEQVPSEKYYTDQKIKVYILAVNKTPKGPEIIVSRRHPDILKDLFALEIPEVANGVVEIKAIAREAGARSKVAVWTKEESIDPIGAAIGQRGVRIQTIINEIGGEKIDIIEYSDDPEKFIANSLAPAKASSLKIYKKEKSAVVKLKKNQLSLAIGKAGQNVRLASQLTGWKIEIKEEKTKDKEETPKESKLPTGQAKKEETKEKIEKKKDKETTKKKKKEDEKEKTDTKKSTKKETKEKEKTESASAASSAEVTLASPKPSAERGSATKAEKAAANKKKKKDKEKDKEKEKEEKDEEKSSKS
ncbi:transcription termination factor NusA [Patescibacteria group bacterium AH-259-L07]|nr:transcription termination factor NusA [Patescibacteria group bacterium AH-259-L07]